MLPCVSELHDIFFPVAKYSEMRDVSVYRLDDPFTLCAFNAARQLKSDYPRSWYCVNCKARRECHAFAKNCRMHDMTFFTLCREPFSANCYFLLKVQISTVMETAEEIFENAWRNVFVTSKHGMMLLFGLFPCSTQIRTNRTVCLLFKIPLMSRNFIPVISQTVFCLNPLSLSFTVKREFRQAI